MARLELRDGELLAVEVLLDEVVVDLGDASRAARARYSLGLLGQVGRDLLDRRSPRPCSVSPRQVSAFMSTRSTTPTKSLSAPIGSWMTSGLRAEAVDDRLAR